MPAITPNWLRQLFDHEFHTPTPLRRVLHFFYIHLGYRGLAFVAFGGMYIFIGVGVATHPNFDPNLRHTYLPIWFRFSIWGILGAVALSVGVIRSLAARQCWGIAVWLAPLASASLFCGPAERALSFLWAFIVTGDFFYAAGTGLYFVLTLTVLLFSAWPEPPDAGPVTP
jgi:hypothetical protein